MGDERVKTENPDDYWPEVIGHLDESYPQYARLAEGLDEVKESIQAILKDGLMTDELRQDLYTLAKAAIRKLEEPDESWPQ